MFTRIMKRHINKQYKRQRNNARPRTSGGKNKYEKPHIKYEICTYKINLRQKSVLICTEAFMFP